MKYLYTSIMVLISGWAISQSINKNHIINQLESKQEHYSQIALKIWDHAELGFLEDKSIELLMGELNEAGFSIEKGVAGMSTAFIAEWGESGPIIGMLAEYDALPGMSQKPVPEMDQKVEGGAGHACGHHMFGTASVAAAIAVKDWLMQSGVEGRVRLYGTPAEEGGGGKVFMVRAGLFDDVDAVLTWHPGDANQSSPRSTLAAIGAKFTFKGIASHAARFPDRGRSALDGIEAMNDMVNLMREHIPQESRIHYAIQYGGGAPNVVPSRAVTTYIIRHPDMRTVRNLYSRVLLCADGAALGTQTNYEVELQTGYFNILPNGVLSKLVHDNLSIVGGVEYDENEMEFAVKINETFRKKVDPNFANTVGAYDPNPGVTSASTDVGDISWVVPTTSLRAATWVPGTSSHSWQAVAAGGMSIGMKGMMVAAKTLAISAVDLFKDPGLLAKAKAELLERRGEDFKYESLIGDMAPPLEYRVGY